MGRVLLMLPVAVFILVLLFTGSAKGEVGQGGPPTQLLRSILRDGCNPVEACPLHDLVTKMQKSIARNANNFYDLNEDQLREICRDVRNLSRCQVDHIKTRCLSATATSFRPLIDTYFHAEQEIMKVCENPSLFADYQAVVPCVQTVRSLDSTSNPPSRELRNGLEGCGIKFMLAGQSAVNEIYRLEGMAPAGTLNDTVNSSALLQGFCCGTQAFKKCGTRLLTVLCSGEAVAVVKKHTKLIFDSFKCSEILSGVSCPSTDVFMV